MTDIVSSRDGVYGARMTGGGFGGCVVALADASSVTLTTCQMIIERYTAATGRRPDIWITAAADAA
jgi:galactokinase